MATVFDLLEREWQHLACDRAAARRLADVRAAAGGAPDLAGIEAYVRAAGPVDADRVLVVLARRAADRDELAARVLLQMLLPGTRSLARRWWALGDADERAAAAVAAVYRRIRTYPIARRPGRVAANVLLDAAQEIRRSVPRTVTVPHPDPGALAASRGPAAIHPAMELAEILLEAVEAGTIDRRDAEVIARSRIGGERVADIAAGSGLQPRTVWDRRQRAERTLVP